MCLDNVKYKKEDCGLCDKGKIIVKLKKFKRPRQENCPICNGRRYLTVQVKEN